MPINEFSQTPVNSYLPAVLKKNKDGWLIEYYVANPSTHELSRKRIKLKRIVSRYKSTKEAKNHINSIILTLNAKLAGGWNPFHQGEDARLYEKFDVVIKKFLAEKGKELRENSLRSYKSFCNIFSAYLENNASSMHVGMFNRTQAVRYLDYIYGERQASATTYNNQLKVARTFFSWAKDKGYTKENPFETIKPKRRPTKKRIIVPVDVRRQILEYLKNENNPFLTVCKLVYTSLIRPNEIRQIRIENISTEKRYIYIPADVAKNHKARYATITEDIISDLNAMHLARYPKKHYLFGGDFSPSKEMAGNARYRKEWDKLRKKLKLPNEMQLYSLRDTGIFDMLKSGIDDLTVMQHADHHSLDMTTRYANHADPNLNDKIYNQAPKF